MIKKTIDLIFILVTFGFSIYNLYVDNYNYAIIFFILFLYWGVMYTKDNIEEMIKFNDNFILLRLSVIEAKINALLKINNMEYLIEKIDAGQEKAFNDILGIDVNKYTK